MACRRNLKEAEDKAVKWHHMHHMACEGTMSSYPIAAEQQFKCQASQPERVTLWNFCSPVVSGVAHVILALINLCSCLDQ